MKLILNMKNTGRSDYMRYEIKGGMMPVVEIILEAGESINCEKGAMVWMSPNMQMQTSGGGVGKMFTRAISGESMFRNTYTAQGGPGLIAFGSSFVGNIMAVEIGPGKEIICQKSAYLASTPGINLEIAFQKKIAGGFFGGEGFIMQRITGQGIVFLKRRDSKGWCHEYVLWRRGILQYSGNWSWQDNTSDHAEVAACR